MITFQELQNNTWMISTKRTNNPVSLLLYSHMHTFIHSLWRTAPHTDTYTHKYTHTHTHTRTHALTHTELEFWITTSTISLVSQLKSCLFKRKRKKEATRKLKQPLPAATAPPPPPSPPLAQSPLPLKILLNRFCVIGLRSSWLFCLPSEDVHAVLMCK